MASITGTTDLDVEMMWCGGFKASVTAGPKLRASKWRGGVWVEYVVSDEGDFVVEKSKGSKVAGCLFFASENYNPGQGGSNNNWTSYQPALGVGGQNVVTIVSGGMYGFFKLFETVALSTGIRNGSPIVYSLHDVLYISENGLLCNDSSAELVLAGVTTPVEMGIVAATPSARNKNRLGADLKY